MVLDYDWRTTIGTCGAKHDSHLLVVDVRQCLE